MEWVEFSTALDTSVFDLGPITCVYISVFVSVCIFSHSIIINRNKKSKQRWDVVRASTEAAALATILSAAMVLALSKYPECLVLVAVGGDLLWNGLSMCVIQLCDSYIFFNRFKAVQKIPAWENRLIHAYIWLILILTWLPEYTFVPFFWDTNSLSFANFYNVTSPIYQWGVLTYNILFSGKFSWILWKNYSAIAKTNTSSSRRTRLVAIKSLVHCVTSSAASLISMNCGMIGVVLYPSIIVLSLHFIFNFKIESAVCSKKIRRNLCLDSVLKSSVVIVVTPKVQCTQASSIE